MIAWWDSINHKSSKPLSSNTSDLMARMVRLPWWVVQKKSTMTSMKKYAVCFKFLEGKWAIVWTIIMKERFSPIHLCSLKLLVEGSHLSLWRLFWIFLCPLPCQCVLWIYKGFTNLTQSCAYPSSVLHMICEVLYLVKDFPNMQNHILVITRNLLISWSSQSHMQGHDLQSCWSVHTTRTATWATMDKLLSRNIIDCTTRQRGHMDILSNYEKFWARKGHWGHTCSPLNSTSSWSSPSALPPAFHIQM